MAEAPTGTMSQAPRTAVTGTRRTIRPHSASLDRAETTKECVLTNPTIRVLAYSKRRGPVSPRRGKTSKASAPRGRCGAVVQDAQGLGDREYGTWRPRVMTASFSASLLASVSRSPACTPRGSQRHQSAAHAYPSPLYETRRLATAPDTAGRARGVHVQTSSTKFAKSLGQQVLVQLVGEASEHAAAPRLLRTRAHSLRAAKIKGLSHLAPKAPGCSKLRAGHRRPQSNMLGPGDSRPRSQEDLPSCMSDGALVTADTTSRLQCTPSKSAFLTEAPLAWFDGDSLNSAQGLSTGSMAQPHSHQDVNTPRGAHDGTQAFPIRHTNLELDTLVVGDDELPVHSLSRHLERGDA